jgi:lysozyme
MRSPFLSAAGIALICLAACTTGSDMAALDLAPSRETTSSIGRPLTAVPEPSVGLASASDSARVTEAGMTPLVEADGADAPALQQVAMLTPPNPDPKAGALSHRKVFRSRFKDAKPINFGRTSPHDHAVHGVDVSRWQGDIDWQTLRSQGANFAYIKATDGGDHLDPNFMKNWAGAQAAGIRRGAYHFFYWCRTAAEQAEWFIRNVPRVKGALPPVIDVEFNHQSDCKRRWAREDVIEKMQVFMDRLERHYGQRPIVYTSPDFYRAYLNGAFPHHAFWLRSVAQHPAKVYPGREWVFWQYSGSGLSNGVDGRIDLNVFRGDEAAWWRWVGKVSG